MANLEKIAQVDADSEMEEGEIVDELDDLSDISSEEEFLLRQRLEVLEDYNNALERTKKKSSSGLKPKQGLPCNLSGVSVVEINATKLNSSYHPVKVIRNEKYYSRPRKRKAQVHRKNVEAHAYGKRKKDHRKKTNYTRKKQGVTVVNETSDESDDEYRNKRKKLSDAVLGHRGKTDSSSLSARLQKMLHKPGDIAMEADELSMYRDNNNQTNTPLVFDSIDEIDCGELKNITQIKTTTEKNMCEPIDLLTSDDEDVKVIPDSSNQPIILENVETNQALPESKINEVVEADKDSDEDLAQLRQQVLSTKTQKAKPQEAEPEVKIPSEDEDSDTTELRLICLKSTLLKRAIEMKQKQKKQKKLSQSTLEEDIFNAEFFFPSTIESGNNTDIESMDMDMGSDADDRTKDAKDESVRQKKIESDNRMDDNNHTGAITSIANKDEELEEDEDLLRAKLLTSLSKNLPNLVSPELLNTIEMKTNKAETEAKAVKIPEEKRFIIKLGDSDSEGEHEATKNLTKMHMKLSEPSDFQQKLDLFLKYTRMQVENKLPDVVQKQVTPKKPEKFVAKVVNHLPKSEQIEYKNLVKRMAELEKMKHLRQASLNSTTQPIKDTLKPRNASIDPNLEEKISISRKKIADESAKMLKLKEEATKLSQKYKIVSNELHNISTAITLNKKQQRAIQNCLSRIRQQHQLLIKSSSTSSHSKVSGQFNNFTSKVTPSTKLQKENNPKDTYKNLVAQKTVKISVANNLNKNEMNTTNHRLSVEVNVASNKKVVKMPSPEKDRRVIEITKVPEPDIKDISEGLDALPRVCDNISVDLDGGDTEKKNIEHVNQTYTAKDYKSPLDAFGETSWKSDPNAILCPFDVGGQCKDPDCKYLHTQLSEQ